MSHPSWRDSSNGPGEPPFRLFMLVMSSVSLRFDQLRRSPASKMNLEKRMERNIALDSPPVLSNADIADRLASLAQLFSTQKENPYKVKAYQRAAARVRTMSESIDELVRDGSDLTEYAGIGQAIASAV